MPLFNIPVSLNDLFQRIASIYDRSQLSRLNQLLEEEKIFDFYIASGAGIPPNVKIDS